MEFDESADLRFAAAARTRRTAGELLSTLIAERERLEARMAEAGSRDPMKRVTGRSAMENAISSTREMIAAMDQMLAQLRRRPTMSFADRGHR